MKNVNYMKGYKVKDMSMIKVMVNGKKFDSFLNAEGYKAFLNKEIDINDEYVKKDLDEIINNFIEHEGIKEITDDIVEDIIYILGLRLSVRNRFGELISNLGEKLDDLIIQDKPVKVFISQPMKNRTNEEILKERKRLEAIIRRLIEISDDKKSDEILFIDSFQKDKEGKPLYLLGESLKMLSEADIAYFPEDYHKYRGCNIEHKCAKEYGIRVATY